MGLFKSIFGSSSPASPNDGSSWLLPYSSALGCSIEPPIGDDAEASLKGRSEDGIAWTLRVLSRQEPDSESPTETHHLLWHSDAVQLREVVIVFGSDAKDASLWRGLDGLNVYASQIESGLDAAVSELERLLESSKGGGASGADFLAQLGKIGASPMVSFVDGAKPFSLPRPLSPPWHCLTSDPDWATQLFTADVVSRVNACEAVQEWVGGWLRVWIGGPNVRFEAWAVDPAPDSYRHLIDAGLALTRQSARIVAARGTAARPGT